MKITLLSSTALTGIALFSALAGEPAVHSVAAPKTLPAAAEGRDAIRDLDTIRRLLPGEYFIVGSGEDGVTAYTGRATVRSGPAGITIERTIAGKKSQGTLKLGQGPEDLVFLQMKITKGAWRGTGGFSPLMDHDNYLRISGLVHPHKRPPGERKPSAGLEAWFAVDSVTPATNAP